MADGATTKDGCCASFTPPHTWDTDKNHFVGSLNFSHEEKLFQHSDAAKLQCLQPSSSALDWDQEDEPLFWCPAGQHRALGPRDGHLVPLRPGAAMPPPWNCWFFQFPGLTCLGQVQTGFLSIVQDRVEADQAFPWEKAQPWSSRQEKLFCSNSPCNKSLVHTRSSARKHTQLQKKYPAQLFFSENTLFFTQDFF